MLNANTLQRLERNPDDHRHEAQDQYCIDCILYDLLRRDFRVDLAMLATIDLESLARLRAADDGTPWRKQWDTILDPDLLEVDLRSSDRARREAAMLAQQTVEDFLFYRKAARSQEPLTEDVAHELRDIELCTGERLEALMSAGVPALNPNIGTIAN